MTSEKRKKQVKEAVQRWRVNTKQRAVDSLGGCCQVCGYSKCNHALNFHHINPLDKEMELSDLRGSIRGWETIVRELRKCVLLCANCHMELHAGLIELPENYSTFNEEYVEYKKINSKIL